MRLQASGKTGGHATASEGVMPAWWYRCQQPRSRSKAYPRFAFAAMGGSEEIAAGRVEAHEQNGRVHLEEHAGETRFTDLSRMDPRHSHCQIVWVPSLRDTRLPYLHRRATDTIECRERHQPGSVYGSRHTDRTPSSAAHSMLFVHRGSDAAVCEQAG